MSFSALLDQVKDRRDFDAFILGYGRLSLDPDYLRSFFHSDNDKKRGWNMGGYRNPEFDRLADLSLAETDPGARRRLIHRMQQIIMEDIPYLPLYNPMVIEGISTRNFSGWVDMVGGIGNIWSLCTLMPQGR